MNFDFKQHHQNAEIGTDQQTGFYRDRYADSAKQGGCGPERICTRVRHSSARHAAGTFDLRNHAAPGRWDL